MANSKAPENILVCWHEETAGNQYAYATIKVEGDAMPYETDWLKLQDIEYVRAPEWVSAEERLPEEYNFVQALVVYDPKDLSKTIPVYAWHETCGDFYDVEIYYEEGKLMRVVSYKLKFTVVGWQQIPPLPLPPEVNGD